VTKIQPRIQLQDYIIRVIEDEGSCDNIPIEAFSFDGKQASLALAFISPYINFEDTIHKLRLVSGETPLIGISTSGELCATQQNDTLYKPFSENTPHIILQIFSPELIADTAIRSIPLYSGKIKSDAHKKMSREQRVNAIAEHLLQAEPHFKINARDTLALTFFEGLTLYGDDFVEAAYQTGKFPCLFAGGSAGTVLGGEHTYLYNNKTILENYAVVVFLKLAKGKRYSVLKSQNFKKTAMSFIAVDADPETGIVSTLLDPTIDTVLPATAALASALRSAPKDIDHMLQSFSFGVELDNEIFVRSVSKVKHETKQIQFYSSVYQGDELFIVRPTDFSSQTQQDITAFLKDKPKPLGVILNDCLLRRFNNQNAIVTERNHWPCPVAGFSTFGELLGISINQTLTAIAFFEDTTPAFADPFIDYFPIHYARYQDFYRLAHLRRIEVSTRLRADMTRSLSKHLGASPELAKHIEAMLDHSNNLQESLDSIRVTIAREVATENRAQRAEEHLLDAIESMNEGFVLYDKDHRLLLTNSRLRKMIPNGEKIFIPGRTFDEIIPDISAQGFFDSGDMTDEEFLESRLEAHRNPDGKSFVQRTSDGAWSTTRMNRTREGGVVGVRADITEIKKRETEIERLQHSYELLLNTAGDGILGINAKGIISYANPAATRMLGYTAEEMEGQSYFSVLGAKCLPDILNADSKPASGECDCLRKDGKFFTSEYSLTPAFEGKTLSGAVLVFRDITLRKTYENSIADQQKVLEQLVQERTRKLSQEIAARIKIDNALQESQKRLLGITNSLLVGVLLVDQTGLILFANPAAYHWLDHEVLLEKHIDEIFQQEQDGEPVEYLQSDFAEVLKTGQSIINDDAALLIKNGERLQAAFSAALLDEGRRRQVVVITIRGIKALKDAQREAMQASRLASVGQLAAGIAHEINTPIQYIGDNLRFIEDTFEDIVSAVRSFAKHAPDEKVETLFKRFNLQFLLDEYPTAIGQALHGVEHVSHIVRSMKDFSHPGSSSMVCMDINRAVESTLTVCRNEWKQVAEIHTELSPEVGKIQCYAADLNQVLLNLIVNAAHAIQDSVEKTNRTGKGNIYISTENDGTWVEIRITDDGPGIPPHLREQIFAPFFTTKEIGKGTGQGLSICQDIIVKKHNGQLFLDDSVAKGASFVIRLPALACL